MPHTLEEIAAFRKAVNAFANTRGQRDAILGAAGVATSKAHDILVLRSNVVLHS